MVHKFVDHKLVNHYDVLGFAGLPSHYSVMLLPRKS